MDITLTPRQQEILNLLLKTGASNKHLARTLNISESTVKLHITHIIRKYNVRSRLQLITFCQKELTSHL